MSQISDLSEFESLLSLCEEYEFENKKETESYLYLADEVGKLISESENKPLYDINLLDLFNVTEPMTSTIISLILKYKISGDYVLCRSFIKTFLEPREFRMEWFETPLITAEKDRLDVCIQEPDKYAIIIENKLKGAEFQRNQIARYIEKMRKKGYNDDRIFIIVLPDRIDQQLFNHINKSVWYLPNDWLSPNQERACAYDKLSCKCDLDLPFEFCNGCEKDLLEKFEHRTDILDLNFIEWLEDKCIPKIPKREIVLRSAVEQFVDFLKGIFNKRLNDKMIMELEQFLRKKLLCEQKDPLEQWNLIKSKKKEIGDLLTGLTGLQSSVGKDLVDKWKEQLTGKWRNLRFKEKGTFYIEILGIKCGCWCDNEQGPYWGFQCENPNEEQKEIVEKILERVDVDSSKSTNTWIAWDYTLKGAELCETFYQAAKDLNYLPD